MQIFDSGATRDSDDDKLDYEGFIDPVALRRYGEYMHSHRIQADGKMRDSDNWQKGIPLVKYAKSLIRHVIDFWILHRGELVFDQKDRHAVSKQELLCAIIFNALGYLGEELKQVKSKTQKIENNGCLCNTCDFAPCDANDICKYLVRWRDENDKDSNPKT